MKQTYSSTWRLCYQSAMIQAIILNLVPLFFVTLRAEFRVTFEQLGRLILIAFFTQLIVDFFSVYFLPSLGYRGALILSHLFSSSGIFLFGVLPVQLSNAYCGMIIATVIYSIGGGLLEVMISPLTDALPSNKKEASMSMVHSFYCWGQVLVILVTTVLVAWLGSQRWQILFFGWACLPIMNLLYGLFVPLPTMLKKTEKTPLRLLLGNRLFWVMLLMMICGGAAEQSMAQWASTFAEKGLGISKIAGDLFGPCLFAVCMGLGRLLYSKRGEKLPLRNLLLASSLLCILCYATAVFSPVNIIALFGCAFCGFSISLMWPGTLSLTSSHFPLGGTAMFSMLALAGDVGCSLGPWLTGLVSDVSQKTEWVMLAGAEAEQITLKIGLCSAIFFPAVMVLCCLLLPKKKA